MYKRTILWLIVLVAAAGLTTSCLLDPEKTKEEPEDKTPVVFKDLTEKDDVLHNLELSYNERRFDKYEELLDADFIFYFAEVDYNLQQPERNSRTVGTCRRGWRKLQTPEP
jgi:hypothetical protein